MTGGRSPRRRRRRRRRLAAVGVVLSVGALVGVAAAAPVAAAPADTGLWYADVLRLDQVQAVTRGEGVMVAVIDGAVNPAQTELADADIRVHPESICRMANPDGLGDPPVTTNDIGASHGTEVDMLLVGSGIGPDGAPGVRGIAPGITLLHLSNAVNEGSEGFCTGGQAAALGVDLAVEAGADIISISAGAFGKYGEYTGEVYDWDDVMHDPNGRGAVEAIVRAQQAGVVVVASLDNGVDGQAPPFVGIPAGINGVVAVEALEPTGEVNQPQYTGPEVGVVAPGVDLLGYEASFLEEVWTNRELVSGTSFATPLVTGTIALGMAAWPDATPNQILQLLATTATPVTGAAGEHTDDSGFGLVDPLAVVTTDPSGLPDVNPFLRADGIPATEEILAGTQNPSVEPGDPSATPSPDESSATESADPGGTDDPVASESPAAVGGSGPGALPIVLGALALVVALAVVVLVRRARHPGRPGGGSDA